MSDHRGVFPSSPIAPLRRLRASAAPATRTRTAVATVARATTVARLLGMIAAMTSRRVATKTGHGGMRTSPTKVALSRCQ